MWERWVYKLTNWHDSEMSWKWNISSLWGSLTHPFTRTWHWFIKSIQYSIILWSDFDWDYSYILVMLQYKLKRTRLQIEENDLVVSAPQQIAQIKHAEDLIQAYFDDNFCEELYKAHEEKWGDGKMEFTPVPNSTPAVSTMDIRYPKANTEEEVEQADQERHEIYKKHEKAKQECLDEIFQHIRKHIESWWD